MNDEQDIRETARSLNFMMDFGEGQAPWLSEDLEAVLEHQLAAPLQCDLENLDVDLSEHLDAAVDPPIETFADLLLHPGPPVELLDCTKRFAKACRADPESPLPDEIATALYFLAIAAAMLKCERGITTMDGQSLRYSFDWTLKQAWLDPAMRKLLQEAVAAIDG